MPHDTTTSTKQFPELRLDGLAIYTADGAFYIAQGCVADGHDAYEDKLSPSYDDAREMMQRLVTAANSFEALRAALMACEAFWSEPPSGYGCNIQRTRKLEAIRAANKAALERAAK